MNPLLVRHLYGSTRKSRFFWFLSLYLLVIGLLAVLILLTTSTSLVSDTEQRVSMFSLFMQGRILYWFSSVILLITAWLLAPTSALGSVAGEREQRTLDLLRLTTLPSHSLILGKMGAALTTGALYILAPLPLLMSGYWLGGVSPIELGLTFLVILVTMLSKTAWAIYLSTRARRALTAVLIFYGVALATLPLIGLVAILFNAFLQYWSYKTPTLPIQPLWIESIAQHGWVLLTGLHPLTAAIVSEGMWLDQGSWSLLNFPVSRRVTTNAGIIHSTLGTATLPSPWISYTVLMLILTAWLTRSAIKHLERPEP